MEPVPERETLRAGRRSTSSVRLRQRRRRRSRSEGSGFVALHYQPRRACSLSSGSWQSGNASLTLGHGVCHVDLSVQEKDEAQSQRDRQEAGQARDDHCGVGGLGPHPAPSNERAGPSTSRATPRYRQVSRADGSAKGSEWARPCSLRSKQGAGLRGAPQGWSA